MPGERAGLVRDRPQAEVVRRGGQPRGPLLGQRVVGPQRRDRGVRHRDRAAVARLGLRPREEAGRAAHVRVRVVGSSTARPAARTRRRAPSASARTGGSAPRRPGCRSGRRACSSGWCWLASRPCSRASAVPAAAPISAQIATTVGERVPGDRVTSAGRSVTKSWPTSGGAWFVAARMSVGHVDTVAAWPAESAGDSPTRRGAPSRLGDRPASVVWRLIVSTVGVCLRNRVTGLAAEAAFFALLSLPPLIFGLAGVIGYIVAAVQSRPGRRDRGTIVELALAGADRRDRATRSSCRRSNDVLGGPRFDVISIGFMLALWSGSRALNVFVDTITIMYGLGGHRGIVRDPGAVVLALRDGPDHRRRHASRWWSPGPRLVDRVLPDRLDFLNALYWPIVVVLCVCFLRRSTTCRCRCGRRGATTCPAPR